MQDKPITILWFRQDLRLSDNPALAAALACGHVLPIYILDDENAGNWAMGGASLGWLHRSLESLNQSLDGKLNFFRGDAVSIIESLCREQAVAAVYWNRCYEPWRIARDAKIKSMLQASNIEAGSFNGSLLWEPWTVSKKDGSPYQVFTPYYQKGCRAIAPPREPILMPTTASFVDPVTGAVTLQQLALIGSGDWQRPLLEQWQIGESAAQHKLDQFCRSGLTDYRKGRDFPALASTSMLSPHLHFGEISPQQIWQRIEQESTHNHSDNPAHFQRELGWREFSYYQLYHFPELPDQAFKAKFARFEWLDDSTGLQQWQKGQTGIPIIDAGMRELWQTGYMHNRVRMLVASFLIKNLLVHWRHGARWFWDCLLEADLASNSASWQWCAGSGADAAPYFRIFNPVLQSGKFDPDGDYILRFCPELQRLPKRYLHCPWEADAAVLAEAGIKLGRDYPEPIVELKSSRVRALDRFKALKSA
ncbi:MAG: deoxyribodipyrimidine photo-lyase [Planctomycetota bacterium]